MDFLFIAYFVFWNRARGSHLYEQTNSTGLSRLIATFAMAAVTGAFYASNIQVTATVFLWTWASLMFWCTPAWDDLWSATIGDDILHSRLWGLFHLGARMSLAAPCIIGNAVITGNLWHAWFALLTPLLALPYYIMGYLWPKNPIPYAEALTGGLLGFLILL